jgi:hypothetical protein
VAFAEHVRWGRHQLLLQRRRRCDRGHHRAHRPEPGEAVDRRAGRGHPSRPGDGARLLITEVGSLDAKVNIDDPVVAITATYAEGAGEVAEPRPADIELVRAIVDGLGERD